MFTFSPYSNSPIGGRFLNLGGNDFKQYFTRDGCVAKIDGTGSFYGQDFFTADGTSLSKLNELFQTFVNTGLPSVIDGGTF